MMKRTLLLILIIASICCGCKRGVPMCCSSIRYAWTDQYSFDGYFKIPDTDYHARLKDITGEKYKYLYLCKDSCLLRSSLVRPDIICLRIRKLHDYGPVGIQISETIASANRCITATRDQRGVFQKGTELQTGIKIYVETYNNSVSWCPDSSAASFRIRQEVTTTTLREQFGELKDDPSAIREQQRLREPNPLALAIKFDSREDFLAALENGAPVDSRDYYYGKTPLMYAVQYKRAEMAKALIDSGADLEIRNDKGKTALLMAYHDNDILEILLEAGADITALDNDGNSLLSEANRLFFSDSRERIEMLMSHGVVYDIPPLHFAIKMEDMDRFTTLLDSGADVNETGRWCSTPLDVAVKLQRKEMAEELFRRGAHLRNIKKEKLRVLIETNKNESSRKINPSGSIH